MTPCSSEKPENPGCSDFSALEGTGDGENRLSKLDRIKSEKGRELIGVNRKTLKSPSPVPSTDFSRAYGQNDIEDFEFHIARCMRGRPDDEALELRRFLLANPGKTVRDWKGRGPAVPIEEQPGEKSWAKLRKVEVHEAATRSFARELPRNIRQAAARDPDLIWNSLARKYRKRLPSDPPKGRGP